MSARRRAVLALERRGLQELRQPILRPSSLRTDEMGGQCAGVVFQPFRFHDLRHWHAVTLAQGRAARSTTCKRGSATPAIKTTEMYCKYLTPDEQRIAKGLATPITTPVTTPTLKLVKKP